MEKDIMESVNRRIAEVRRAHKVTQEALADMLGVSPKHISHVENATSSFSLKNLIQFCMMFNCSFDYIIFGKQNNDALSKLPDEIVAILNHGDSQDIELLNRYLNIYLELWNKQK